MNDRDDLLHECLNATGGIYWIIQPYHKARLVEDQHWAYLCVCLKRIEQACRCFCDKKEEEEDSETGP